MMNTPIFGLRFKSNDALQPTLEDLRLFLDTIKQSGKKEKHRDDLERYRQFLDRIEGFRHGRKTNTARPDIRDTMLFSVLSHSHFFTPSLRSAIEQYKYHYHALAALDFKKPRDFIRSAEEEIIRLNSSKKDDQLKRVRLQAMVDQRNTDLASLAKRWTGVRDELQHIARYIKENLDRIRLLCESSITILAGLQVGGEKKSRLIEDIKAHFKEQVRDHLQLGPVTKQYVESLKEEVARLSKQVSEQTLLDLYTVTKLYELLYEQAKKTSDRLELLLSQVRIKPQASVDEDRQLFGKIEDALVALISDYQFDSAWPKEAVAEENDGLLLEKRREMLEHLFTVLNESVGG